MIADRPESTEFMDHAMRRLWFDMEPLPGDLRLYGGTALALYLGHRQSTDFDFATPRAMVDVDFPDRVPWLRDACVEVKGGPGMVDVVFQRDAEREIKLTFMECGPFIASPLEPPVTAPNGVLVAHPYDLAVTKLEAFASRCEQRDVEDVAAIHDAWPKMCESAILDVRRSSSEMLKALSIAQAGVERDDVKRQLKVLSDAVIAGDRKGRSRTEGFGR